MKPEKLVFLIGPAIIALLFPANSSAKEGESVWVVRSSISESSVEISQFASIECDAFQLGRFRISDGRIVSEGVHPVIGKIKLTGTLESDGTIKSMGNARASVWINGKITEQSARGKWGETNFGCEGDWSAERAR